VRNAELIKLVTSDEVAYAFGRYGEDLVLLQLFGGRCGGFYVDVGAFHPRRHSNTLLLHQLLGWSGINIDPSTEAISAFAKERPNDINLALAIGNGEARTVYWKFDDPSCNTMMPGRRDAVMRSANLVGEEHVSVRPLAAVLHEHLPAGRRIDLLNVDTAGSELDVLRSNDWSILRPAVIAVSDAGTAESGRSVIMAWAEGHGYRFIGQLIDTSFYALPDFLETNGIAPGYNIADHPPAIMQATKHAVGASIAQARSPHLRFAGRTDRFSNARRLFSEAQADSLSRQLVALRAEHEALRSSLAWRLATPVRKLEKAIEQWRHGRTARSRIDRPSKNFRTGTLGPSTGLEAGKSADRSSPISAEADTFVLYRIIGNDLPPRHRKGQAFDNVAFILANEPALEHCEKRWIVNRIVHGEVEAQIVDLLERRGQRYVRIPFDIDEYAQVEWALEDFPEPAFFLSQTFRSLDARTRLRAELHARWRKNAYVMNNNGARNAALADGRGAAKWILPWDGNCFVSDAAWRSIRDGIVARPHLRYFIVPMARVPDNADLHCDRLRERATEEPQIVFRRDAGEVFDEHFVYGRRSKAELLVRLGVPGNWDSWSCESWEAEPKPASRDAGPFATVGWVARLGSGEPELEVGRFSFDFRGEARAEAILAMLDGLDQRAMARNLGRAGLAFYDETSLDALVSSKATTALAEQLCRDADQALGGDRSASDSDSGQLDRTRLQRLLDDTTLLALAWRVHAEDRHAEHAAGLVRRWFVDPDTKMNPQMRFAPMRPAQEGNEGNESSVIELQGIYYFLDAVRLIVRSGALSGTEVAAFRSWLRSYLAWLETSPEWIGQSCAVDHHGTIYDLQVAAIAAFLEKPESLSRSFRRARERMQIQLDPAGAQPHELERTMTRHYCCLNLQCWVSLARVADFCGDDLWSYATSDGRGIRPALNWLMRTLDAGIWPYPDSGTFDEERLEPLRRDFDHHHRGRKVVDRVEWFSGRAIYDHTSGIAPYWMLARP
jgi:hypothetical protein